MDLSEESVRLEYEAQFNGHFLTLDRSWRDDAMVIDTPSIRVAQLGGFHRPSKSTENSEPLNVIEITIMPDTYAGAFAEIDIPEPDKLAETLNGWLLEFVKSDECMMSELRKNAFDQYRLFFGNMESLPEAKVITGLNKYRLVIRKEWTLQLNTAEVQLGFVGRFGRIPLPEHKEE